MEASLWQIHNKISDIIHRICPLAFAMSLFKKQLSVSIIFAVSHVVNTGEYFGLVGPGGSHVMVGVNTGHALAVSSVIYSLNLNYTDSLIFFSILSPKNVIFG